MFKRFTKVSERTKKYAVDGGTYRWKEIVEFLSKLENAIEDGRLKLPKEVEEELYGKDA
jgi:hypothetical protein